MDETSQSGLDCQDPVSYLKSEKLANNNSNPSDICSDSKRKDLENLLLKKFNSPSNQSDTLAVKNCNNSDHESLNENYDYETETPTDDYDEEFEKSVDELNKINTNSGPRNENDNSEQSLKEFNSFNVKTFEQFKSPENESYDAEEIDLKALNDYIRMNAKFEFNQISAYIFSNPNTPDDKIYTKAEIENQENIRTITDCCRQKFPELKYKISKSIKSAFKEKYREFFKLYSTSSKYDQNKNKSFKSNSTSDTSASNNNRSVSFKDFKTKNLNGRQGFQAENQISNANFKSVSPNPSSSPKDPWLVLSTSLSSSQKHFLLSHEKQAKKHKTNYHSLSTDSYDPQKSKHNSPLSLSPEASPMLGQAHSLLYNFNPANFGPAGPMSNMFNTPLSSGKPISGEHGSNSLKPQMFDNEFLRMASLNPLFRFVDIASMTAANNPCFKNLFRNPIGTSPLYSPSYSPFALNYEQSSPGSFSSSPATASVKYPLNPMPSSVNSQMSNSTATSGCHTNLPPHSSIKKPVSPVPISKSNENYQNHSQNDNSTEFCHQNSLSNNKNHVNKSQTNGEVNVTNKLSAESNGLGLHFPTSSKFKLSSKFSKLSSSEIQTIKTLITGYRESAAFLSRSAEELETLINDSYETNE